MTAQTVWIGIGFLGQALFSALHHSVAGQRAVALQCGATMTMLRWPIALCFMQKLVRRNRNAGHVKPATGNPPGPSGSILDAKPAPLKSETPHEIGGQLL